MRRKSDLRPSQQRAITRLYESEAVQAVMPMGSGKTASAMTAIDELIGDGVIRCAVVLAPKRVAQLVWTKEYKLWEHLKDLKVRAVAGTPAQRNKALFDIDAEPAHVYVVGIDNLVWLLECMGGLRADHKLFDLLVIDELSRFKNPRGKRGKALQNFTEKLPFRNMWGLTGTPRPNGYVDQYRPMQLLTRGKLWNRSFDRWQLLHFMQADADGNPDPYGFNWTIRPEHEAHIVADISRYSFTIDDVPETPEPVPVFHWIDLPKKALDAYKEMERKLLYTVDPETGEAVLAKNAAVASGKLAQVANGFMYDEQGETIHLHTEKADMLVDLLEGSDENTIICYEFREDLNVLKELWPKLPYFGAGVSDAKALAQEDDWNKGRIARLGLHPASGGHGLNLQYGGRQMVFYSMPWSPEQYDQTRRRIARPGQDKTVYMHHILARNTVDEAKYNRVVLRMNEQEAFRNYLEKV